MRPVRVGLHTDLFLLSQRWLEMGYSTEGKEDRQNKK
jgi:hypothetical protein